MNPEEEAAEMIEKLGEKYSLNMGDFPEPVERESMVKFIQGIVSEDDARKITKTANLREEEVGHPKVSSIDYFNIAQYAGTEGYQEVKDYLEDKAGITGLVSLGRKAKLLEAVFTVRRETKNIQPLKTSTSKSLFGGKKVVVEGGEER